MLICLLGKRKFEDENNGQRPVPECLFVCKELNFIVEPGEIIVLNTNVWYHKTFVISENEISITIGSEFD